MCRKVHDRVDVMIVENTVEQGGVTSIANDELTGGYGRLESGRQVVERDYIFAIGAKLAHDVAADVSGATCDENLAIIHLSPGNP
jgi:hypothetical protein